MKDWPALAGVTAAYRRHRTRSAGQLLRSARLDQRLSMAAVSARSGISLTYINDIEHGTCGAPVVTLVRIARELGVDLDALHRACRQDVLARFQKSWEEANEPRDS